MNEYVLLSAATEFVTLKEQWPGTRLYHSHVLFFNVWVDWTATDQWHKNHR